MARLGSAITSSQTTIPLLDYINPSDFPQSGVVLIESEQINYTNTTDKELIGCTRGFGGTSAASHVQNSTVELIFENTAQSTDNRPTEVAETYSSASSHQTIAADLTLASGAGRDVADGTSHLAAIMGHLLGSALTKTANYLAGVIGKLTVTGSQGSHYQVGGVLGIIGDGVTEADGAFVAVLDGDSAVTTANAAFAVRKNNSVPGSDFAFGLDLKGAAHDGFTAVAYSTGEIRFSNGTKITVSGDTITFTNAAGNKTSTITMS